MKPRGRWRPSAESRLRIPSAAAARRSRRRSAATVPPPPPIHPPPVEQAVAAIFAAEKDVLGHGTERNEVDLLIDGADPAALSRLGRREIDRLGGEQDRARVSPVGARQNFDHGGLSGAVLADKRHDLARL